jgi:hypothetical protein
MVSGDSSFLALIPALSCMLSFAIELTPSLGQYHAQTIIPD